MSLPLKKAAPPVITRDEATGWTIITDYQLYVPKLARLRPKRALLSYVTGPLVSELNGEKLVRFSNYGLAVNWVRALNELGYIVDMIDWDNTEFQPAQPYDLVVFHGGKNFAEVMPRLREMTGPNRQTRIIHYLTGSYWKFNNDEEDKRLADFKKRHGVAVGRDRFIHASEDAVNEAADSIIVLGDPSMRHTYPKNYKKVLTVNNGSYPDDHFTSHTKDYEAAKHNFLFYAGAGSIHKGLDLLIDAFKTLTDQHLYIVANTDPAVMKVFGKELKRSNIHHVGEVGMRTKEFYDAMDACAFVILPSCSEGQAGSVVEAMNQGLIPIVSKETRLDAREYGFVLAENSIAEIINTVTRVSSLPSHEVAQLSHKTHATALRDHSPESFRRDLKQLIKASF